MNFSRLDDLLSASVEGGKLPGIVLAVSDRNGLIYEGARGVRRLGQAAAMTTDTLFWFASMTKAITTTAALQCVERGQLSLDAPASEILPVLAGFEVLEGFDAKGEPRLRAPKRPITLRHLLTHTSGLSYEFACPDVTRYRNARGVPDIFTCKDAALMTPLMFDPGERWEYGTGIDFAGKMVEAVSGQRLGEYITQNITAPLGMTTTSFHPDDALRAKRAGIHARSPAGVLSPSSFDLPRNPEFEMGGGGLFGIIPDYHRFLRMILNKGSGNGHQILKPETVALMATNQIGDKTCGSFETAMPELTNSVPEIPGTCNRWGLGFMISEVAVPGGRAANSLSWAGLANTYYWIDPTNGIAVVVAAQILPFFDMEVVGLMVAAEQAIYAALGA
jgi:methyl acetate hydrolase